MAETFIHEIPENEIQSNKSLIYRYGGSLHTSNSGNIDSFGKTFVFAALFPVFSVLVIFVIWKVLKYMCDKAICTDANPNRSSSSNGNPRPIIRSSLSSGHYTPTQESLNAVHDLHSIFIFDWRALPQVSVDNSKEEPPPSYHDAEVLTLPSYDEAMINVNRLK